MRTRYPRAHARRGGGAEIQWRIMIIFSLKFLKVNISNIWNLWTKNVLKISFWNMILLSFQYFQFNHEQKLQIIISKVMFDLMFWLLWKLILRLKLIKSFLKWIIKNSFELWLKITLSIESLIQKYYWVLFQICLELNSSWK